MRKYLDTRIGGPRDRVFGLRVNAELPLERVRRRWPRRQWTLQLRRRRRLRIGGHGVRIRGRSILLGGLGLPRWPGLAVARVWRRGRLRRLPQYSVSRLHEVLHHELQRAKMRISDREKRESERARLREQGLEGQESEREGEEREGQPLEEESEREI